MINITVRQWSPDVLSSASASWRDVKMAKLILTLICWILASAALSAPSVSNVSAPSTVGLYEKFEVTFDVSTVAENVYWPYDPSPPVGIEPGIGVSVDLLLSDDGWKTSFVKPCFYYQRYEYINRPNFGEWIYPVGSPLWCGRFSPPKIGEWRWKIRVQDREGITFYPAEGDLRFTCVDSTRRGHLRVSITDPRYFEFPNGDLWLCGLGLEDNTYGNLPRMEAEIPELGASGINLLRTWWQGYSKPYLFGYPRHGWPAVTAGEHMPSRQLSWKLGLTYPSNEITLDVYVRKNTRYRISGFVKTRDLIGTYGVVIWAYDPNWKMVTPGLIGTNDWTEISAVVNSGDSYLLHTKFVVEGCTSGSVWISHVSIREDLGNGQYGPELVDITSPEVYKYFKQLIAFRCDRMLDICEQSNVWLKIVAEEKQDPVYGRIMADGSYNEAYFPDGTSLYATPASANRRYQEYYWRFLVARFGHSTAVHSWELFNEADPFDGRHYEAANAFAKYMHDNNPNRQMVSTSMWHSYPTAEFWANPNYPELDYCDVHAYTDVQNTYRGYISANIAERIVDGGRPGGGSKCLKVAGAPSDSGKVFWKYKIPVAPLHKYKFSGWLKAENLVWAGGNSNPANVVIFLNESTGWHGDNNGGLPPLCLSGAKTAYSTDWEHCSVEFTTKSNTHFISAVFCVANSVSGYGYYDDLTLEDLTTGETIDLLGLDFEDVRPVYGDSAIEHHDFASVHVSLDLDRRQIKKPLIRGETGLSDSRADGDECPELDADVANLWLKKKVWAQILPSAVIEMPWWRERLDPTKRWAIARPYAIFFEDIPLNNGHYINACAVTTGPNLRAWGQKDLVNNRAHLWIDNAPYTWKAVVDHYYTPEPWSSTAKYMKGSTCGGGTPVHIYKSKQDNNVNHPVTDTAWWEDLGEFKPENNPPLPPPVSGTVTVSGFKDGPYKIEWWDTSTGTISKIEDAVCVNGKITLNVTDLQSDIACKIYPAPPKLDLRIIVPTTDVVPGQVVTVTVEYTNSGESEAREVTVTAAVPEQMEYVAGSAEASGGKWDAQTGSVSWVIDRVPAKGTGTRTFQARVK